MNPRCSADIDDVVAAGNLSGEQRRNENRCCKGPKIRPLPKKETQHVKH